VVLLREGPGPDGGLEVHLHRRWAAMAFAGGACVFPGGSVDPRDHDPDIGWAGPPVERWAGLLGSTEPLARALVCAAVRELFEESGVLLAGTAEQVVTPSLLAGWSARDRRRLEAGEIGLAGLLRSRGLALRSDLLRWWARWVTPAEQPRRYDTHFFVAQLPEGQATLQATCEAEEVMWLPVPEAVAAADEGRLSMLRPTYETCRELAAFATPAAVLAAAGTRAPGAVR
jgi:8-oxo-dGTP pyrophosphatase MutT (NUDIX family)